MERLQLGPQSVGDEDPTTLVLGPFTALTCAKTAGVRRRPRGGYRPTCYRGVTRTMKTHDLPYAIGAFVLNVQVDLVGRGLMTREGHVPDMKAFKDALVSSIKKPITILPGEDVRAKLAEGQLILTQICVFVVMRGGHPVDAGFREGKLVRADGDEIVGYVVRRGDRGQVEVAGDPALTRAQQKQVFAALARDLAAVRIFDNAPPPVAAALRAMLGE